MVFGSTKRDFSSTKRVVPVILCNTSSTERVVVLHMIVVVLNLPLY